MALVDRQPTVVSTEMHHFLELADGGSNVIHPGTAEHKLQPRRPVNVELTDMRTCDASSFTLDVQGFQLMSHKSAETAFDDKEKVKQVVYSETSELLKAATGATRVVPFSHLVRKDLVQTAIDAAKRAKSTDMIPLFTPSYIIHVDQSYSGAVQVLTNNLDVESVARLVKSRWGIINVWRPIGKTVMRDNLGVCDARSVPDADLREVYAHLPSSGQGKELSKGSGFSSFNLAYGPGHKWYYASHMTPDEVLLIKQYDSKTDGTARRTPHGAFGLGSDQGPPRQSIEVRCLVFWEDQPVDSV